MNPLEHRRRLGAFLRARREALTPRDAGLHGAPKRRRTPGLRREEVALLCGLSPTWYTWLEQGRDVSMSPAALARIAAALHLSAAERAYLFELASKRDPEAPADGEHGSLEPLLAALESIAAPAYVLDARWQACGANAPARRLLTRWLDGPEPNLLRYVFLDPDARVLICDWAERARRVAAEFRADTARRQNDAELAALVDDLAQVSPEFAAAWSDHAVLAREGGTRAFQHPLDGQLHYRQITLVPAGWPGYKLVMLVAPASAATQRG
jgi:transcriptional regulator with XRE-family HTH domain